MGGPHLSLTNVFLTLGGFRKIRVCCGTERHRDFMVSGSEKIDLENKVVIYVTDQIGVVNVLTDTVNYKSLITGNGDIGLIFFILLISLYEKTHLFCYKSLYRVLHNRHLTA